jgi:hypothetical protein
MLLVQKISFEIVQQLIRAVSGRIFTEDQIKRITSDAIGKHFADFFPTAKEELHAKQKAETARMHIHSATTLIREMQHDLEEQDSRLQRLLLEVEEKKALAERYQALAHTNKQALDAFRAELEESLRRELVAQAEKGRGIRRAASISIWVVTLVLGAALGTYFKDIVDALK